MLEVVCHISWRHFSLRGLFLHDLDVENIIFAQSFPCVEVQIIWKLNPALCLETKMPAEQGFGAVLLMTEARSLHISSNSAQKIYCKF